MTETEHLLSAAYHEAGHFVVWVRLRLPGSLEYLSIIPGDEVTGLHLPLEKGGRVLGTASFVLNDTPSPYPLVNVIMGWKEEVELGDKLWSLFLWYYAGFAAQYELDPANESVAQSGSCDDFHLVRTLCQHLLPGLSDDEMDGIEQDLRRDAIALVRSNWQDVVAVASALFERKTLNAEEATVLLSVKEEA